MEAVATRVEANTTSSKKRPVLHRSFPLHSRHLDTWPPRFCKRPMGKGKAPSCPLGRARQEEEIEGAEDAFSIVFWSPQNRKRRERERMGHRVESFKKGKHQQWDAQK